MGLKENLEIMIDTELNRFNDIYAAAGHPNAIFKINLNNLVKITKGALKEISE